MATSQVKVGFNSCFVGGTVYGEGVLVLLVYLNSIDFRYSFFDSCYAYVFFFPGFRALRPPSWS